MVTSPFQQREDTLKTNNNVLFMKQDCKIAEGVLCDVIRQLYQGSFFFQNVIRFHGARVNVIYTFTPMVFCADCNETHQSSKLICSDLSYDFHQKGTTAKKSG